MRCALATSALVVAGFFAAACSDERSPLPTEPPLSPSLTTGRSCTSPLQLAALTVALFAPGDLLTFARSTQTNISLKMSRGDVAGARTLALAFVDFTLKNYYQGKLRDPNGNNPPTTAEAVVTLIDGVLCWVGLPSSGLQLVTTGSDVTVTTKVIGSSGGQFKSTDQLSGLKVPPGAVSDDRLWVITRRDDLANAATCVSTTLKSQIPLCIDFSVVPAQDVAVPLVVAICQPELNQPADRRLAHKLAAGIELLAVTADPFPLVCTSTPDFPPSRLRGFGRALWRAGSFVARVLGPKLLHATHSGLGGLLGPKMSPVTAVQVRLSFDVQPTNTEPSHAITPAVQVAFKDFETGAVATEVTNRIEVRIGANPGRSRLLGDTIRSPSEGIASFANLTLNNPGTGYTLVADALSSDFTGDSLIHSPATSDPFNVASLAELTIGDLAEAPADPTTGDAITLSGIVANSGGTASGPTTGTLCAVHFFSNGGSFGFCGGVDVPGLAPGGSAPINASLNPLQAGTYTVTANVDSAPNNVVESNENNAATGPTFTVAPASDVRIASVSLSSTTLTIGGTAGAFNVPYTATIVNGTDATLSVVLIQAYVDQGAAHRAANGADVTCGPVVGALPPGTCPFAFSVEASNGTAGSGTLVPGDATARFELKRFDTVTQAETLLDTFTVPVTLVSPLQ